MGTVKEIRSIITENPTITSRRVSMGGPGFGEVILLMLLVYLIFLKSYCKAVIIKVLLVLLYENAL